MLNINQGAFRYIDITQLTGNIHDRYHAAAFHHHFAAILIRRVHHLLHPIHIGRKGRNNDALVLML